MRARDAATRRPEIDGLRAVAVLAVVAAHSVDPRLGPFAVDVGSRGVDLFFVLSGFCLSYPYLARPSEKPLPTIANFLRHRFARIAPPYYVALALFGALACTRFGLPTWPQHLPAAIDRMRELGLDAAFLTDAMPMHNADFWTLGVEMRWYVLFPLILVAFVRSKIVFGAIAVAAIVLYRSPASVADFGMLTCFMSGIVAAALALRSVRVPLVGPAAIVMLACALVQQHRNPGIVDHGDLLWQCATFLIVVAATSRGSWFARVLSHPILESVGIASYSIYLVNHPIFEAAVRYGAPRILGVALAIGFGFAFWALVERPLLHRRVRARIENALRFPLLRKPVSEPA